MSSAEAGDAVLNAAVSPSMCRTPRCVRSGVSTTARSKAKVNSRELPAVCVPDGIRRLQELLEERNSHQRIVISTDDVLVSSTDAETMTAAQWGSRQRDPTRVAGRDRCTPRSSDFGEEGREYRHRTVFRVSRESARGSVYSTPRV